MNSSLEHHPNPFVPTRFEFEGQHVIWVSPRGRELEEQRSFYVAGSRGSGKTTLLRSLDWSLRVKNEPLRDQDMSGVDRFVGVYLRIPDFLSNSLALINWEAHLGRSEKERIKEIDREYFSFFVEVSILRMLCNATVELRAAAHFTFSIEDERTATAEILDSCPGLKGASIYGSNQEPQDLVGLRDRLTSLRKDLHVGATQGAARDLVNFLPGEVSGATLHNAAQIIVSLLGKSRAAQNTAPYHIKVCLDDCESLRPEQQIYLNTLVRTSKFPVFWVVSYVGGKYEGTATAIHQQSLSDADRRVLDLEAEEPGHVFRFHELCDSVARLRVLYSDPSLREVRSNLINDLKVFDPKALLGRTDINALLKEVSRRKLTKKWNDLERKGAEIESRLRPGGSVRGHPSQDEEGQSSPSYYQGYIIEKLAKENEIREWDKLSLGSFKAYLRKKQRAAFLCICSDFRVSNIPYAGWNVVYSMSDGCIRDFLDILGAMFDRFVTRKRIKIEAFRNAKLSTETQRKAIKAASEQKFGGILDNVDSHGTEVSLLIECFGMLTARLQANHRDVHCLRNPERGLFVLDFSGWDGDSSEKEIVKTVMHRGETAGLLRSVSTARARSSTRKNGVMQYRLHRRFCAKFGFSYAGPYAAVFGVPVAKIAEVCTRPDQVDPDRWVDEVAKLIRSAELPKNLELFKE